MRYKFNWIFRKNSRLPQLDFLQKVDRFTDDRLNSSFTHKWKQTSDTHIATKWAKMCLFNWTNEIKLTRTNSRFQLERTVSICSVIVPALQYVQVSVKGKHMWVDYSSLFVKRTMIFTVSTNGSYRPLCIVYFKIDDVQSPLIGSNILNVNKL